MAKKIIEDTCQECYEIKVIHNKKRQLCAICYSRWYYTQRVERSTFDNTVFVTYNKTTARDIELLKGIDAGLSDIEMAFHYNISRQYSHRVRKKHLRDAAGYHIGPRFGSKK